MPQFNLDEYELVEDRIRNFYADHPDGRIVTWEQTEPDDRAKGYFVVRAAIYVNHEDQHANCPKATGLAFEIEGTAGANRTASLENAETSAIGRALANADYAKGKRPSRTEMEKAARGPQAKPVPEASAEFSSKIHQAQSREELAQLWEEAKQQGMTDATINLFGERGKELADGK